MTKLTVVFLSLLFLTSVLEAQVPYYQGKSVRIVVGYLAGDTHDVWARTTARYLAKHIPGSPDIIVVNMPGAGSMIAANHVYAVAKPDGLTLGTFSPSLYHAQLTGRREVQFDWAKFTWIGSPVRNGHLLYMRSDSPYKTLNDIRKATEPPRCSATGVGTTSYDIPKLLEDTLGLKFRIITGYPGGAEQDLALDRGEVDCRPIPTSAFFGREPFITWFKKGLVQIMLQTARQRNSKIPDVPTIFELMDQYMTSDARRRFANVYLDAGGFGDFPVVASPGVPSDRTKILREAYTQMLKDPEFLADANKRQWEINPVSGERLEALAKEVINQPPEIIERMKKVMGE